MAVGLGELRGRGCKKLPYILVSYMLLAINGRSRAARERRGNGFP